jgi:hemerythrin-like domain-containing protein
MTKSPAEILEAEHGFIAQVVSAASLLADKLEAGQPVEAQVFQNIVEFMRVFADKCHHGKEEDLLFPLLEQRGVPMRGCPVEALTREHAMGRALVKGLAEAADAFQRGDPSAQENLVKNLRGITELYPNHIWKEDYLLFPLTNKVLSAEDQQNLAQAFAKVEETIGREAHQRLELVSEQLAQTV